MEENLSSPPERAQAYASLAEKFMYKKGRCEAIKIHWHKPLGVCACARIVTGNNTRGKFCRTVTFASGSTLKEI